MSPRPRTIADADILEATRRVMGRLGPARFTLAAVAGEVGLAPATLVQRFGSKRNLLLNVAKGALDGSPAEGKPADGGRAASPLAQLRELLGGFAGMATSPAELANHLAFLQIDLTDPAFHRVARTITERNHQHILRLLRAAALEGELEVPDAPGLAWALLAAVGGSLVNWGIVRKGKARDWLLRDCDAVLAPYRTRRQGVTRRSTA